MTRIEFISSLEYYLKKSSAEETTEIIADYNAHFDAAEEAGFSDEEIIRELGSPKEIYDSYKSEGVLNERPALSVFSKKLLISTKSFLENTEETTKRQLPRFLPQITALARKGFGALTGLFYFLCTIIALIIALATLSALYMLAVQIQPFSWLPVIPAIHPLTLAAFGCTGFSAAGAVFFLGQLGKTFSAGALNHEASAAIARN